MYSSFTAERTEHARSFPGHWNTAGWGFSSLQPVLPTCLFYHSSIILPFDTTQSQPLKSGGHYVYHHV